MLDLVYTCLQKLQLSEKSSVSRRLASSFLVLIPNLVLSAEAHRSHVDLKVKSEAKSWLFSHDFMPFHIFNLMVHLEGRCHELTDFFAVSLLVVEFKETRQEPHLFCRGRSKNNYEVLPKDF